MSFWRGRSELLQLFSLSLCLHPLLDSLVRRLVRFQFPKCHIAEVCRIQLVAEFTQLLI